MSRRGAVVAGVAGWPIGHSLSPLIHGAWLAATGLDAAYLPFAPPDVPAFDRLVARVRQGELAGLNVTAPYKTRALELCNEALGDRISDTARACGSVNLLWHEAGALRADSTDGHGLMSALSEQAPQLQLGSATVLVLGAGGAARAAVHALGQACAEVRIVNRTPERARALVGALSGHVAARLGLGARIEGDEALVVNALSGPAEVDLAACAADCVLMDMRYRPLETEFLARGRARGLAVVDGLAMLIGQARPSFRILFGQAPPMIGVRRLALQALEAPPTEEAQG